MLKDFRKKLNGRLGLAAVLFGCALFLFLSISTLLLFDVFWTSFKSNSLVVVWFIPVIMLQIPGLLIDGFVQINFWMRSPWTHPNVGWIIISFYSSVFWSVIAYGLLRFERWWESRKK